MSSILLFVYDYRSERDIMRNICLGARRYSKGYIDDVTMTLTNGYANVLNGGTHKVEGVLFKMIQDDYERFKLYIERAERGSSIEIVKVDVNLNKNKKEQAYMIVAKEASYPILPSKEYFDMLKITYKTNQFDAKVLKDALKDGIKKIYCGGM